MAGWASLAFYRLVGVDIVHNSREWPPGTGAHHAAFAFDGGVTLEFDNPPLLRLYAADAANVHGTVIGFPSILPTLWMLLSNA